MADLEGSIQIIGKTAAQWTAYATPLLARQPGVETDTGQMKVGDGVSLWPALEYVGTTDGGSVDSVVGTSGRITVDSTDPANPILDIPASFSAYDRPLFKNLSDVTHTGTTSETTFAALTWQIAGNTVLVGDQIYFYLRPLNITGSGNKTIRLYVNDSNTLVGATMLGMYSITTSSTAMQRTIWVQGATETHVMLAGSSFNSDMNTNFNLIGQLSTFNLDWTTTKYFFVTMQLTVSGDQLNIYNTFGKIYR